MIDRYHLQSLIQMIAKIKSYIQIGMCESSFASLPFLAYCHHNNKSCVGVATLSFATCVCLACLCEARLFYRRAGRKTISTFTNKLKPINAHRSNICCPRD